MAQVMALRVQRGDWVSAHGHWREVKAVRSGRYASGGPLVVLIFKSGPSLRVNAADVLTVEHRGRAVRGSRKEGGRNG
ncbi:hypothetical protein [Streptomyces sp. NBC_01750]|uniref:hypothetical protein n=1 Tax=Streptomyces sp. NBC_01750 TaxID=2975928 RepID=UPI002DD95435|nr:hypothetical protein [Streptomyces sp. NBC_01750]WSD33437.1 hypothetical protein OG966_16905 [Streptomyces sp. NBC_01750]